MTTLPYLSLAEFRLLLNAAMLVALIATLVPCWLVCRRAGYAGWWGLLILVPGLNAIAIWVFAFKRWPRTSASEKA